MLGKAVNEISANAALSKSIAYSSGDPVVAEYVKTELVAPSHTSGDPPRVIVGTVPIEILTASTLLLQLVVVFFTVTIAP